MPPKSSASTTTPSRCARATPTNWRRGGGTGGSRSIPLGGVSVVAASDILATKLKKLAADDLEASPQDIELIDGTARIAGTDRMITFADIARKAKNPDDLKADADIQQAENTYPNGTHVAEVEIDPETGMTQIVAYTIVDDFGVTVNPMLLAGPGAWRRRAGHRPGADRARRL